MASIAQIYLEDSEDNSSMIFPITPDKIKAECGGTFQSYDIMNGGEIKIPYGSKLTRFSWSGILPGESRGNAPYVLDSMSPLDIQSWWSEIRTKKHKCELMITDTPINHTVYLEDYSAEYTGGHGDYEYTISFVHAPDLIIESEGNDTAGQSPPQPKSGSSGDTGKKTYTVKAGDCMYNIAAQYMGNGKRYPELYAANKALIDARNKGYNVPKYTIYIGQVLTIP